MSDVRGTGEALFQPLTLRGLTLKNRVMMSPMCQYSAVDGLPNDWHRVHLGARAQGGVGLIMTEATAVLPEGRISPGDTGIWNLMQQQQWSEIVSFTHSQGAAVGIQLGHAGRKASTRPPWEKVLPIPADDPEGWQPVGPTDQPLSDQHNVPHALTVDEIHATTKAFAEAAVRADKAGFDVIELHAAHGYLLHSFLSPVTNTRSDEYGGDFAGRMRFLLETAEAARAVWPEEKPLFVRISTVDWLDDGWQLEDSKVLIGELAACGVDLVDCSSGGINGEARRNAVLAKQTEFAAELKREEILAIGAVGGITEAEFAGSLVERGDADLAILGRELLRKPYWTLHAALELGAEVDWPVQYLRAKPRPEAHS